MTRFAPRLTPPTPSPMRTARRSTALAAALSCAFAASAQSANPPEEKTTWALGVGVLTEQQAYAGMDRENRVRPIVRFENQYIEVVGAGLGLKLPSLALSARQELEFRLLASYDDNGYKSSDAPILNGMDKRKGGVWLGGSVEWHNPVVDVSAAWQADASGNSKGQRISLGLERAIPLSSQFVLTPRLQGHWFDDKYVDYYYGVRSHEARAGRAAYQGSSGTSAEVGISALYKLNQRHSLMLDVSYTRLADSIKDSPLVDRNSENRVFIGYLYRFQ